MLVSEKEHLVHYGVIGMHWGVRKLEAEGAEIARKKGETVHHVSEKADVILRDGSFYTSFTKKDILHYRSNFADEVMYARNVSKVFDHSFTATETLISPTKKRAIDELVKLSARDGDILTSISKTKTKSSMFLTLAKVFGIRSDKKEAQKYRELLNSNKPEDKEKAFHEFMAYMLLDSKSQKKYFDALSSNGFNSIYDFNDILNKVAEKPLIVFDAKNRLVPSGKETIGSKESYRAGLDLYDLQHPK